MWNNAAFKFGVICSCLGVIGTWLIWGFRNTFLQSTPVDRATITFLSLWPMFVILFSLLAVVVGVIAMLIGLFGRRH